MKRARFSEEQIIGILKAAEAGGSIRSVCQEHNITEQTFYRWRRKYGGMEVSEAKKLRDLEGEIHVPKNGRDVRFVGARSNHAGAKFIGLPELKTNARCRRSQCLVRHLGAKEREHSLLLTAQTTALSLGEGLQDRLVLLLEFVGMTLSSAATQSGRQLDEVVHDPEVARVVEQAAVGADLTIDPLPELDIGLEFRGAWKITWDGMCGSRSKTADEQGEQQSIHGSLSASPFGRKPANRSGKERISPSGQSLSSREPCRATIYRTRPSPFLQPPRGRQR